jgi:hypothetical protein
MNYRATMCPWFSSFLLNPFVSRLIGVAKTCHNMRELRDKMVEMYGKSPVQLTLYLPTNKSLTFPQ